MSTPESPLEQRPPKDELLVAVDKLAQELGLGSDGLAFTWDQMEAINGILGVHAHELAEKIRANIITELDEYGTREQQAEIDGMRAAADLIDPEKETER